MIQSKPVLHEINIWVPTVIFYSNNIWIWITNVISYFKYNLLDHKWQLFLYSKILLSICIAHTFNLVNIILRTLPYYADLSGTSIVIDFTYLMMRNYTCDTLVIGINLGIYLSPSFYLVLSPFFKWWGCSNELAAVVVHPNQRYHQ